MSYHTTTSWYLFLNLIYFMVLDKFFWLQPQLNRSKGNIKIGLYKCSQRLKENNISTSKTLGEISCPCQSYGANKCTCKYFWTVCPTVKCDKPKWNRRYTILLHARLPIQLKKKKKRISKKYNDNKNGGSFWVLELQATLKTFNSNIIFITYLRLLRKNISLYCSTQASHLIIKNEIYSIWY